ncbi:protein FAM180A-like [Myripristis murdjan]|uniref:protein FAM180A-like n=1 Tax=Myripristis murdjan TaxID=586833 RepID=UPI00117643DB|nr:protein FAM180A-like [Myripristis murdjan]
MLPGRVVVFGLLYCFINTVATQRLNKVLFPTALRIKRGTATLVNPTFHKSLDDVNLLFEILLSGLHFGDSQQVTVKDAELASLRKTKSLEVICTDIMPRKLPEIRRLTSDLSSYTGHLHQDDFERTLLTMVFTAQHMVNSTTDHQRDIWAESFVSLYKAIKKDLTGKH